MPVAAEVDLALERPLAQPGHPLHEGGDFRVDGRSEHRRGRLPVGLGRGHAQHALCGAVDRGDAPFRVEREHARRDRLELQLAELRGRKAKLSEEKYFQELEKLLLELAAVYDGT